MKTTSHFEFECDWCHEIKECRITYEDPYNRDLPMYFCSPKHLEIYMDWQQALRRVSVLRQNGNAETVS